MNPEPPSGSRISVTTEGAHPLIVVPHGGGGLKCYFYGLFFLANVGLWFAFLFGSSGDALWLIWCTLGGAGPAHLAYRSFRPSVPESLKLMPNGVTYDSGIPPFLNSSGYTSWNSIFPKRTRVELDRRKLQSLRLRGNRLTVDADALRLDIAQSASEIEREWLYQLLANRYSLPLLQGRQK